MEKKIILTMSPSKDIDIVLNGHDEIIIRKDSRIVKADDIYNFLKYERGDTFVIESVNEQNMDTPVLQFFTELLRDITDRLNRLSTNQDEGEDEEFEDLAGNNGFTYSQEGDEDIPF